MNSKYLYVSKLFAAAVFMMLNIIADATAPATESENREFFRVIATGFTAISLNNKSHLNGDDTHDVILNKNGTAPKWNPLNAKCTPPNKKWNPLTKNAPNTDQNETIR